MKIQQLIVLGALLGASHAATAGIMITIEDLNGGATNTKSTAGSSLSLELSESAILQKYFQVSSSQQGVSDAGFFFDFASVNASSSNLVATQTLVNTTTLLGGPAVAISFEFDGFLGPTGLVEWTSTVNAAGIAGLFYDATTLVNGNTILFATNINNQATNTATLLLETNLPLTVVNEMRIGATQAGQGTRLSFDIDTVGQPIPLPGSLALVGIGLAGLGFAGVRQRRKADL
jgi:hypothetical protein